MPVVLPPACSFVFVPQISSELLQNSQLIVTINPAWLSNGRVARGHTLSPWRDLGRLSIRLPETFLQKRKLKNLEIYTKTHKWKLGQVLFAAIQS